MLLRRWIFTASIANWTSTQLFVKHFILSQSTSLVRENVLYLTELFVEITRLGFHGHFLLLIVHEDIPLHVHSLEKLTHFKSDQNWYRDESCGDKDPSSHRLEKVSDSYFTALTIILDFTHIIVSVTVSVLVMQQEIAHDWER